MSIISQLTEKIILQKNNDDISKTTVPAFLEVYKAKAKITPTSCSNSYEIIILKPPAKFNKIHLTSVKWNSKSYACISNFVPYKNLFMKGTIVKD